MSEKKKGAKAATQSIELHAEAVKALEAKLDAELTACVLEKGRPNLDREARWGWEFAESVIKYKGDYLDRGDAWSILIDFIKACFADTEYEKLPSGKLTEVLGDEKTKALRTRIIDYIKSIPRSYSVYLRFYHSNESELGNQKVAEGVDLIQVAEGDGLLQLKPTWDDENPLLRRLLKEKNSEGVFFKGNTLLRIQSKGFSRGGLDDSAITAALSKLKCTLYFGGLLGVFKPENRWSPWGGKLSSDLFVVDETANDGTASKTELPPDIASYTAGYALQPKPAGLLDARLAYLKVIGRFLDADADDANKTPLATAAEWAYDSAASANETVSFVQLCIALEAILGDEKLKDNVTKTLADRCAYLLGKTVKDRVFFRERFEKLYDQRSKIVHGRRVHLGKEATEHLYWGRNLLNAILQHELRNFQPTEKPETAATVSEKPNGP